MQPNTHTGGERSTEGGTFSALPQCVLRFDWFVPGAGEQQLAKITTHNFPT